MRCVRYLDGVALLLTVATLALLILPGTYHRLVEKGNASGRLHALTNKLAVTALIPFTVSLGIDVGIIGERMLGLVGGITAGVLVGALALFFCYGLESWRMRSTGQAE